MAQTSPNQRIIVASDSNNRLICNTNGLDYTPDPVKHVYGLSSRRPLEDWFLDMLGFFKAEFPDYEIFTLGSSCVFGQRFITYLTVCEFEIGTEQDFRNLQVALRESDQAIRRKFHALWNWKMAAIKDKKIAFLVGHLDFAYFLLHREEFRNKAHTLYMRTFTTDTTIISSRDYKVLHDGTIVPFEPDKLGEDDKNIYKNYGQISFETISF
jgi:hypothetical protein